MRKREIKVTFRLNKKESALEKAEYGIAKIMP